MSLVETRPHAPENTLALPSLAHIDSDILATGFRNYNLGIGVPTEYQERIDDILDYQTRYVAPELADHGRRVGGYAGALLMQLEHPLYSDTFHEGIVRIVAAGHDIGKQDIKRDALYSSLGYDGYPRFTWERYGASMEDHPANGFLMIQADPEALPPEAKYGAGCHHQYADPQRNPYGIDLSVINRENSNNPDMAHWVQFMVKVINLADYFDAATSRDNDYFDSDCDKGRRIYERAHLLFPGREASVIQAMRLEQTHYLGLLASN